LRLMLMAIVNLVGHRCTIHFLVNSFWQSKGNVLFYLG